VLIGRCTSSEMSRLTTAPLSDFRHAVRHGKISDSHSMSERDSTINNTNLCTSVYQCSALKQCHCPYQTTHTHTFNGPVPGLPGSVGTRKVKSIWILLKQETVSGSGISWAICKSAPRSRQITTPAPYHSVILQAGCPSCQPTTSKH